MRASANRRVVSGAAFAFLAASTVVLTPSPATAEGNVPPCGSREKLVSQLGRAFGEQRHNMMLDVTGNLVELYGNVETGSWTMTLTPPGGPTCIWSSGGNFIADNQPAKIGEQGS